MADYLPQSSGLWSTTTWITAFANLTAFAGGNTPPTIIDDVYADGKTITVNVNTAVNTLRTTTTPRTGGLAGGGFRINNAVSLSANLSAGTTTCLTFLSAAPSFCTLVGSVTGGSSTNAYGIDNTSTGTINVVGNILDGTGGSAHGINNASTGTINITGNLIGNPRVVINNASSGRVNILGNVTKNVANTNPAVFNNTGIVSITGNCIATDLMSLLQNATVSATAFIHGSIIPPDFNIVSGTSYISNAGSLYIYGNVGGNRSESSFTSTITNTGSAWVYGNVLTAVGRFSRTIHNSSATSYLFVSGNIYGSTGTTSFDGSVTNLGICEVIGNVYGGNAGSSTGGGIYNSRTLNITGNVFGGHATRGIGNFSPGITTVVGTAYGGPGNGVPGIVNADTGIVRLKRAVGNSWGLGYLPPVTVPAPGVTIYNPTLPTTGPSPGINGAQNSQTFVEELELGPRGQWPTAGNIYFTPNTKATSMFETDTFQPYTLIQSNSADNLVPPVSSVRQGEVYNLGSNTGACIIPPVSSVAAGALVDNLAGTAVLTPQTTWNYPTTASDINSMGGRLRNALNVNSAENLINSFSP